MWHKLWIWIVAHRKTILGSTALVSMGAVLKWLADIRKSLHEGTLAKNQNLKLKQEATDLVIEEKILVVMAANNSNYFAMPAEEIAEQCGFTLTETEAALKRLLNNQKVRYSAKGWRLGAEPISWKS